MITWYKLLFSVRQICWIFFLNFHQWDRKVGISCCYGNYCWLAIVLWCWYCPNVFESCVTSFCEHTI